MIESFISFFSMSRSAARRSAGGAAADSQHLAIGRKAGDSIRSDWHQPGDEPEPSGLWSKTS